MGYVYVRNGNCYLAYRRPDGRWVRESAGTDKRTLAKALLSKKEHEMLKAEAAGLPIQSDIRLEEFVGEYRRHAQANKKESSVERDETSLTHLIPVFGKMRLREITSGAIQRYVDDRRLIKRKNGKRLRAATIRNEVHTLSAIFREAVRRDLVLFNPVSKVKKPKEDNMIVRYLLPEEDERLHPKLPDRIKPMVMFDLHTGLRKSELFKLEWPDVDLDQNLILVRYTKTNRRYLPLNAAAAGILEDLAKAKKDASAAVVEGSSTKKEDSIHVFLDPASGEALKSVERAWRKAKKEAEITNFRFHDLRHTFASRLVQAGVPLQVVKELLGHKHISTTERYAHLGPTDMRDAVAKLVTAAVEKMTAKSAVEILVPKIKPKEEPKS